MHKFLRTVGFSNYKKKHDIEKLLQDLIDQIDPSQIHKIQIDEETNLCQVRAEMAHDMGLDIYGEMDEFGESSIKRACRFNRGCKKRR